MLYWAPVLIYAAIIFYLSSLPSVWLPMEGEIQRFDPERLAFHIVEYSILGYLLLRALVNTDSFRSNGFTYVQILLLAVFLGSLYGMTDELHQHFVPNRTPSLVDWFGDTLGSLVGSIISKARYIKSS